MLGVARVGVHEAAPRLFGVDDLLDLVDELLHLLRRGAAPVTHRRLGVHQLRPPARDRSGRAWRSGRAADRQRRWAAESRAFPSRVTSKLPVVPGSAVDEISRSSPNSSTSCFSSATKYLWPTAIERLSSAMKTERSGRLTSCTLIRRSTERLVWQEPCGLGVVMSRGALKKPLSRASNAGAWLRRL